jgi:hypothetical protein
MAAAAAVPAAAAKPPRAKPVPLPTAHARDTIMEEDTAADGNENDQLAAIFAADTESEEEGEGAPTPAAGGGKAKGKKRRAPARAATAGRKRGRATAASDSQEAVDEEEEEEGEDKDREVVKPLQYLGYPVLDSRRTMMRNGTQYSTVLRF